jgi:hypothetical protein
MPFYLKPVVWNDAGYVRPSGAKFSSGYPRDHGYGHEEWNNSPQFSFDEGRDRFRVFHTEGLGTQDLEAQSGRIAMALIASHRGGQYLVSVACGCISLLGQDQKVERLQLAARLGLDSAKMAEEAWALPSVREAHQGSRSSFLKIWRKDFHWIPNWVCPADLFLPLSQPVLLDPVRLTGRKRLITMFGSYQEIDASTFATLLSMLNGRVSESALARLKSWAGSELSLPEEIESITASTATERAALIQARIGQGAYRVEVMKLWDGQCAVTGCGVGEALRASHIRPWSASTNSQRLDPENGLLLAAHIDALFDRGLISFDDQGEMLVSKNLGDVTDFWGLGGPLRRQPSDATLSYLSYHRSNVFRGEA